MTDADYVIKVVLCGAFGCGKTSLATRYARNTFQPDYKATIGVDFFVRITAGPGALHTFKLHIWDTSGQERYASVMPQWFRGAQVCCFVFDVCRRDSFEALDYWLQQAQHCGTGDVLRFLVAAQTDRSKSLRVIDRDEAMLFATKHGLHYAETSALTGEGVEELFETIVDVYDKQSARRALNGEAQPQDRLTFEESVLLTQQQTLTESRPQRRKNCLC